MRSSKSRSRSKNNRNRSVGNIVNRVFDSSGPEGKVRGTPQQIIDKYMQLARDAQLANDRVAAENFQQHAEHYTRMLAEALREQEARREAQEREQRERQQAREAQRQEQQRAAQSPQPRAEESTQPDVIDPLAEDGPGLVETPEGKKPSSRRSSRSRKSRQDSGEANASKLDDAPEVVSAPDTPEAAE